MKTKLLRKMRKQFTWVYQTNRRGDQSWQIFNHIAKETLRIDDVEKAFDFMLSTIPTTSMFGGLWVDTDRMIRHRQRKRRERRNRLTYYYKLSKINSNE